MKKHLYLVLILLLLGCNKKSPIDLIKDSIQAIDNMPSMEFSSFYNMNQEDFSLADTSMVYIEQTSENGLLPIKYVFESKAGDYQFFDGNVFNNIMASERTIIKTENPPSYLIESNQGLIYSPFYIRNLLDYLLKNDQEEIRFVGNATQNGVSIKQYTIEMDYIYLLSGKIIRNGDLLPNQIKAENIQKKFEIGIDEKTSLPVSIKEVFTESDFVEVSFSPVETSDQDFKERAEQLANDAFLLLTQDEYMKIQMAKQAELIGTQAKEFKLQSVTDEVVDLADFEGRPVLLEFWFPGCSFCMAAVPEVNKLAKVYLPKGLQILGVEISNASKERLEKYISDQKVEIPILTEGKALSLEYSVNSGPSFILLDKDHTIVYRGNGLDYETLVEEVEKVL